MDDKTLLNPEKAAERILLICATKTGGSFPKRLDVLNEFGERFPKNKAGELPDPEARKAFLALSRVMTATRNIKAGPSSTCGITMETPGRV